MPVQDAGPTWDQLLELPDNILPLDGFVGQDSLLHGTDSNSLHKLLDFCFLLYRDTNFLCPAQAA